jgi:hypothetical protein
MVEACASVRVWESAGSAVCEVVDDPAVAPPAVTVTAQVTVFPLTVWVEVQFTDRVDRVASVRVFEEYPEPS